MSKAIFLDVDGVLNTKEDWWKRAFSLNAQCVNAFCSYLWQLEKPQIILSSTWRNGIARDGTTAAHIDDLLNALASAGIHSLDRTPTAPDGSRSKEIDYYLRRHEIADYLILDDDPQLFDDDKKTARLYVTDSRTGFTENDAKKLLKKYGRS